MRLKKMFSSNQVKRFDVLQNTASQREVQWHVLRNQPYYFNKHCKSSPWTNRLVLILISSLGKHQNQHVSSWESSTKNILRAKIHVFWSKKCTNNHKGRCTKYTLIGITKYTLICMQTLPVVQSSKRSMCHRSIFCILRTHIGKAFLLSFGLMQLLPLHIRRWYTTGEVVYHRCTGRNKTNREKQLPLLSLQLNSVFPNSYILKHTGLK